MAHFFNQGFFGGMGGGMGGGFGGGFDHEEEEAGEVDNKQLYEALEVESGCTQEDVKKAYKRLVRVHHPDKGGDEKKFKEVQAAYEVLNDPEKRKMYDKYGLEGLKSGGMSKGGFGDIFDIFFGGGGRRNGGQRQTPQLKPTVMGLKLTLSDVYHGKMAHVDVDRKVLCEGCNGKGGSEVEKCTGCKGRGVVVKMIQLGPGMYSQSQADCNDCKGTGEKIKKENICKTCKGNKLIEKKEKVEVPIAPGIHENEKIMISGKGNEHPEYRTGDLVIVTQIEEDSVFKRAKNDLIIEKSISLIEALGGFEFNLKHLNGQDVTIKTEAGDIVQHKAARRIPDLGMPKYKEGFAFGDLIIIFEIVLPNKFSEAQIAELRKHLPKPLLPPVKPTKNVYTLEKHDVKTQHKASEQYEEEEDDEHHGGGQRVQCNQQ